MDYLIKAAMALAVLGVIYGIYSYIDSALEDHYVTPVKEVMQAQINNEKVRADAAEAANAGLRSDLAKMSAVSASCSAEVAQLKEDEKEATRVSDLAINKVKAESMLRQAFIKDLIAKASGAPTPGDFCEQAKKAYGVLIDIARDQRLRDKSREATSN